MLKQLHVLSYIYNLTKSMLTNWEAIEIPTLKHTLLLLIDFDFNNLTLFRKLTSRERFSRTFKTKL